MTRISDVADRHIVKPHSFADDTQLYRLQWQGPGLIVKDLRTSANVNQTITRICAAEMAVRYAALCACRKVHT